VQAVVKAVASHLRPDSMVVVFGCASDKDVSRMLPGIAAGADKVIFTRADASERSMDPRELARKFTEISQRMFQIGPNLKEALALARRAVGRGDIILVTGSFLMAGQTKRLLMQERASITEVKPHR
jgi:folylpolyglutamate synthase/dihydropteroate synthase